MSKQLQEICVERARGLKSDMNVYFICRIGSQKSSESNILEFRSKTISNTKNPEWNVKFYIDLTEDWVEKSSKKDGLELTLQIYGDKFGKDEYVGSVTVDIPNGIEQKCLPIVGGQGWGNVTLTFNIQVGNIPEPENCIQQIAGDSESKHSDGKSTDIGEGGPEPSFWFYNEQRKSLKVDYRDFIMHKADQWGKTVPIMEKGTLAILPHEEVAKEMESFCERWSSNSVYRGNDLGLGRLAPTLFMDLPPKSYMTLSKLLQKTFENVKYIGYWITIILFLQFM